MTIITVHQSLSFETITKTHPHRLSAEAHMTKVLRAYGDWPQDAAVDAARAGRPVLVREDGDDETIEIRDVAD
ncbi:hypothetical protein HNO88_002506 [Novosphingobium chloroacetimidivorans]|uniref:Uncharacterized protein n=1 Tax=Novosphingobium chloroacetimidivorans TaxID=1428314 RepID=A0A7W7NXI9_9SPHN|nr:hypothetical protein [Novosphingobium chloroacetimidivorans]MBB4859177.1 hypothetical protein [Novosphingobium chloroacetimidivorans]